MPPFAMTQLMNKKKINTIIGPAGAFIGNFARIAYIPQILVNLSVNKAQL